MNEEGKIIASMDLSESVLECLKDLFEIEILKAEKIRLDNGLIRIKLELEGVSAKMFKDLVHGLIKLNGRGVTVKIAGQILNPN